MQIILTKDIKTLRETILESQGNKCKICGVSLPHGSDVGALDHQHLFKSEELGVNGAGLIRGVLCRDCNALEGKIWNSTHRYGKSVATDPVQSRIGWLESLVEYYKESINGSGEGILHPKERRIPVLQKSEFNRLMKHYKEQPQNYKRDGSLKAPPKYTGRWSKTLEQLKKSLEDQSKEKI